MKPLHVPAPSPRHVTLAHGADVAGFRQAARALLAAGVDPAQVDWHVASVAQTDLFDDDAPAALPPEPPAEAGRVTVPAFFVPLCAHAALHLAPERFALLYRLAWRLVHEPGLRHDPLDADRIRTEDLARQVRRDMHKMTAFVRFRPLQAPGDEGAPSHVAWFEPEHHIVEATAPFFARRFAQMRWAILTPHRSVCWDGQRLRFAAGAARDEAPGADADEGLWLTYYRHIFNPARLKLKMMQKEMPRRYWKNLPEATLIQPLVAAAAHRSGRMVEAGGSTPAHRRPAASLALRLPSQDRDAAIPITSLATLREHTDRCRACPIGQTATQAVHGEGPPTARLMLVGEQPGDLEDLHGRPFVGPAGQLLDRALAHLAWRREALYLTNALKHFKFVLRGQRRMHKTAAQHEAAACLDLLEHEITLVRAQAAIALGATAARALLGHAVAVTSERGRWFTRPDGLRVLVTLHPAALLRMEGGVSDSAFAQWVQDLRAATPYAPIAAEA